jgi:3-oxoacyl-(acyl-carrier-protein) synthase
VKRRVVITGLGLLSPVGNDVASTWRALVDGANGVGPITQFDTTKFPVKFACELKGFDPLQYMDRKEVKRNDVFTQMALAASVQAMSDAGLSNGAYDPENTGVIIGPDRRVEGVRGTARRVPGARSGEDLGVLHPDVHSRHGRRHRVHPVQRQGA